MSAIGNKTHVENSGSSRWLDRSNVKNSGRVSLIIEGALKLLAASALVVAAYFTIKCAIIPFYASSLISGVKFLITLAVAAPVLAIGIFWVGGISAGYVSGMQDVVAAIKYKEPQVPKDKLTNDNL